MKLKKLMALGLTAGMLLSFTACGNLVQVQGKDQETVETSETALPAIGDTLSDASMEFTVHSVQAFAWGTRYFLIVDWTYTHLGDDVLELQPAYFQVFCDNEQAPLRTYDQFQNMSYKEQNINPLNYLINTSLIYTQSKVKPGRTERGYLIYEYYRPFTDLEIQVGNLCVYAKASDIQIIDAESQVMMVLDPTPTPEPTEETTAETTAAPVETTAAPAPSETQPAETQAPAETPEE